jgi:hypothetical protein
MDNNKITVKDDSVYFDQLFNQENIDLYVNKDYSVDATIFLSAILKLNEDQEFNENIIGDDVIIYSKIANLDLTTCSFDAAFHYSDEQKYDEQDNPIDS